MKKNIIVDSVIIGLALFSTFFGAGNLIFPPAVGLESGTSWGWGAFGLLLSAIILPVLSIFAVNNAGNDAQCLMYHTHPKLYKIMSSVGWLFVGIGSTIPRCCATTHELGIANIFPNLSIWVTVVVFFVLVFLFAKDKDSVVDKLGKYLTPILLITIAVILIKGIADPVGTPEPKAVENPFTSAVLQGYAIGDLTLGLMSANIFIYAMRAKGYPRATEKRGIMLAGFICIIAMSAIYGCLTYIGATGSSIYPQGTPQTALLSGLVDLIMGKVGLVFFGVTVLLACLTTAVGVVTTIASFYEGFFRNKISYRTILIAMCIVCGLMASTGVANIIDYVTPIFLCMYPPFIAMTMLGLFDKYIPNDGIYKGGVFTALAIGACEAVMHLFPGFTLLGNILSFIPLYEYGFTWVVPSIAAMIIGGIMCRNKPRQYYVEEKAPVTIQAENAG